MHYQIFWLQYFRLASRAANLHTDDTGGGIDSENKHNKKKTRTADSSIPDAPLKKQKLKENISLMISELKDIGMYSEELMTKSRKRRDVKKKEACDLELKHAQKVFYCNRYIYMCLVYMYTKIHVYIL